MYINLQLHFHYYYKKLCNKDKNFIKIFKYVYFNLHILGFYFN